MKVGRKPESSIKTERVEGEEGLGGREREREREQGEGGEGGEGVGEKKRLLSISTEWVERAGGADQEHADQQQQEKKKRSWAEEND